METEAMTSLLNSLSDIVNEVTSKLKGDILETPLCETLEELTRAGEAKQLQTVTELEQAKLLNLYSYILVTLQFTSQKLRGARIDNNSEIMQEIKKVKDFMDRVKTAEDDLTRKNNKERAMEEQSEKLIQKHINGQEPAVSNVHFQGNKMKPEGNHVRFDNSKTKENTPKKETESSSVKVEERLNKKNSKNKTQQKVSKPKSNRKRK